MPAAPTPAPKREAEFSIPVGDTTAVESPVARAGASEAASLEPTPVAPRLTSANGDLLARVRVALRETDKPLDALLNGSCEVVSSEGDRVVLGFFHTFHLERA